MALQPTAGADYEDQTAITWTDQNYPHALNRYTALHYFEMSPFFDPASNNTHARQQGRDPGIIGALEFVAPSGGLEYVVDVEQAPHLFVIRKQQRRGPDTSLPGAVTLLAFYYILDKIIYQAPTLHAVVSSRIRRCVWALHKGFDKLQADLDPLVQLRKQQQQEEKEKEQQRQQQVEGETAQGSTAQVERVPGRAGGAGAEPEALAPLPIPRRVPPDEAAYWKRTDNIILTVLSGYPVPQLPDVYYQAQTAAAAQQPPLPTTADGAEASTPAAPAAAAAAAAAPAPAGQAAAAGTRAGVGPAGAGGSAGGVGRGGAQAGARAGQQGARGEEGGAAGKGAGEGPPPSKRARR